MSHKLCGLETSMGRCLQDGERCGWRVVKCAWDEAYGWLILLLVALFLILMAGATIVYFGKPKNVEPVKASKLYWKTAPQKPVNVTVTAYSPTVEECDDDPFTTAFNKHVKAGTIAVSRDLEEVHGWRKGDMVYLEGIGTFEVWDRMNKRWEKAVDIFFHDTRQAKEFGKMQAKAEKL